MTKIAIIGSPQSGRTALTPRLGKKGDVSDITMYDFTKSGTILAAYALAELKRKIKSITVGIVLESWDCISVSTTTFEGMEELKERIFSAGAKVDEENGQL